MSHAAAIKTAHATLAAGLDKQAQVITDKLDDLIASHGQGGKAAFEERVQAIRTAIEGAFSTANAMHQVAMTVAPYAAVPETSGTTINEVSDASTVKNRGTRASLPAE